MKLGISQISKSFGDNLVLNSINLEVQSGKALGILGRNGAGKTTAIRIIMGVFPPDSGTVLVDDKPINRNKIMIGYLPEERGLYPKKIILEQLLYFGMLRGMSKKEAMVTAKYWLERLQMSEYTNKPLGTLSKGNQQKIQLAATLVCNPDVVILDEPFSGLDPVNAMLLKEVVKELIHKDKIVMFSSHQMNYIEEFCDDIAILNGGGIVLNGGIKDIKRSYDRSRVLIESSEAAKIKSLLDEDCTLEEGRLTVNLKAAGQKGRLLEKLAAMNVDIDEIKVWEPTLNDIFVQYTEGGI